MSKVFFKTKPWQNLGVDISDAMTSTQALQIANLNFDVVAKPLFVDGNQLDNYKANVRSDNGSVLGVVGNKYEIVQNKDAFSFLDGLAENGMMFEAGGVTANNKKVWLLGKLDDFNLLGDDITPYLYFQNTFDGSGSVSINVVMLRQVCANGMTYIIKDAKYNWSIRHTSSANDKLQVVHQTLNLTNNYIGRFEEEMDKLTQIKIDDSTISDFVDYVFPMPMENATDRLIRNIESVRNDFNGIYKNVDNFTQFRNTAYGLYQAITDLSSHYSPLRETKTFAENRFMNLVKGNEFVLRSQGFFQNLA